MVDILTSLKTENLEGDDGVEEVGGLDRIHVDGLVKGKELGLEGVKGPADV